jgi:hypothetical protein
MDALPIGVQGLVGNYVCQKVHNGAPSQHGVIICLVVEPDKKITSDVEEAVNTWVFGCLNQAHRALDFEYDWEFVANVYCDQRQINWHPFDYSEGNYDPDNMIEVAVHFGTPDLRIWPLIKEPMGGGHYQSVDPADVLAHFTTPPAYIHTVGISGVSETVLASDWADIISRSPLNLDREGKGKDLHPMHTVGTRGRNYVSGKDITRASGAAKRPRLKLSSTNPSQ